MTDKGTFADNPLGMGDRYPSGQHQGQTVERIIAVSWRRVRHLVRKFIKDDDNADDVVQAGYLHMRSFGKQNLDINSDEYIEAWVKACRNSTGCIRGTKVDSEFDSLFAGSIYSPLERVASVWLPDGISLEIAVCFIEDVHRGKRWAQGFRYDTGFSSVPALRKYHGAMTPVSQARRPSAFPSVSDVERGPQEGDQYILDSYSRLPSQSVCSTHRIGWGELRAVLARNGVSERSCEDDENLALSRLESGAARQASIDRQIVNRRKKFGDSIPDLNWDAIQSQYEDTQESVKSIADQWFVTPSAISTRAISKGWILRKAGRSSMTAGTTTGRLERPLGG